MTGKTIRSKRIWFFDGLPFQKDIRYPRNYFVCHDEYQIFQMFSLRFFLHSGLLLPQSSLRMVGNYNGSTNTYFLIGVWPLDFTRKIKRHARKLFFLISFTSVSADIILCARMLCTIFLVKFESIRIVLFCCLSNWMRSEER